MSQQTEQKPQKEKKDLMYWVKLLAIVLPLLGGGTYYGSEKWQDDEDDEYDLQETNAEQRSIQMEQDDKPIADDQEVIDDDAEDTDD